MSDSFNDREKGFEAKYKLDEEQAFKVAARRNKLLGEWLADQFSMSSAEKVDYAKSVVISDLEEAGDEDVVRKVMADIAERGAKITDSDIRTKLAEMESVALEQLKGDFPDALGEDHS